MTKILKNTKKSLEVIRGQTEVKGHTEAERLVDRSGATPNPNGHLVFELSPKNRFLTPN